MKLFSSNAGTGQVDEFWPVLLLLLVVAVPTVGVLWFVGVAIENQQLASKQRLTEAYQSNLHSVRTELLRRWDGLEQDVREGWVPQATDRERFLEVLRRFPVADSCVCVNGKGDVRYPVTTAQLPEIPLPDERWKIASGLENTVLALDQACKLYRDIAQDSREPYESAVALQAQVRCLLKMDQKATAIALVDTALQSTQEAPADSAASHVMANVELVALEQAESGDAFDRIWSRLHARVFGDVSGAIPSSQRRFIMRRMTEMAQDAADVRLLDAEDLAANWVEAGSSVPMPGTLEPSKIEDVWQYRVDATDGVLLLRSASIQEWAQRSASAAALPSGIRVQLIAPTALPMARGDAIPLLVGPRMPGWRLWLSPENGADVDAGTQRSRLHLWTAALVVLFTAAMGVVITRSFQQKLRLANLKNSLVGTVSHELKTPLASMRLLVETLLDEETLDENTTREYLQLIDKENVRLSRLIDNFLTFSRMERGRHNFQFEDVQLDEVIAEAVDAMGDRLMPPQCDFHWEVPEDLPEVWADHDGLVTVCMNLLDNAYKYSGKEWEAAGSRDRQIRLVVKMPDEQRLQIRVADNGIGLSRTATRRVFERFFQVDQSLVRQGQGCGLGLSIVDFVVRAHRGTIDVVSERGVGSEFCVTLPVASGKRQGGSSGNA